MVAAGDDFMEVVTTLTTYVQNERVRAYNEGVDDMIGSIKKWMELHSMSPIGTDVPGLLDSINAYAMSRGARAEA